MLSRVAQRIFWMSRYLERAELTAKIVNTFCQMRMDLPKGSELPWRTLPDIFGSLNQLEKRKGNVTEYRVVELLVNRIGNPSSLKFCISSARENARMTRHLLPEDMWELINELNIYVREQADKSLSRRNRFEFLTEITKQCQTLNGLVMSTQPRDDVYTFITFGHLLERVDVTSRVIGKMSTAIEAREENNPAFDSLIWSSLLESLSILNAYRQIAGPLVEPEGALELVVLNPESPRSVVFCLSAMRQLASNLRSNNRLLSNIDRLLGDLSSFAVSDLEKAEIAGFFEVLQIKTDRLYNLLSDTWFVPEKS